MGKKSIKEEGIAPGATNATGGSVAGTSGDVNWAKQKKKLRDITGGGSCGCGK